MAQLALCLKMGLPARYEKFLEECRELNDNGHMKKYQEKLRSINSLCVPYCLSVDPKIRNFLENLNSFKGMPGIDISNYLYHESLRIKPGGCKQPPKLARK